MMCSWYQWDMQSNKIAFLKECRQFVVNSRKSHLKFLVFSYIVIQNFHIKTPVSNLSNKGSNSAKANNTNCPPPNLRAKKAKRFPLLKFSLSREAIRFHNSLRDRKQQSKRVLGYCFCKNSRRVGHKNFSLFCRCYVNVIVTNRIISNNF